MIFSAADKADCAERELRWRWRVYPRRVKAEKMSQAKAAREIALMEAILKDYRVAATFDAPDFFQEAK
jgi:hypothetical protein